MTTFLSGVTPRGSERVRRVREAANAEEMRAIMQQMTVDFTAELAHGPIFTAADEYMFWLTIAARPELPARVSAASYDGAAQTALSARAFHEALVAFEQAEDARPCPERRKTIVLLRRALRPGVPGKPAKKRWTARTRRGTQP